VKGIVVAIQALIFDGLSWNQFARHLNEKGYTVYAQDFRGYGDWLTDSTEFGGDQAFHFGQSKDDLTNILKALRQKYPDQKIYCLGESLGANMAIWEASTDPKLMDGAIVCGLTNKNRPLRPHPHWAITLVKGLNDRKRPMDIKPYMNVLTEDKSITSAMLNDGQTLTAISPTDLIKANITNKNALKEVENIPPAMPILVIAGAQDKVQKTDSLTEIIKRIGSQHKELVVLPGKGHLLLEHRAVDPEIAQLIDGWLEKRQSDAVASTHTNEAAYQK
jgi:alpha-beta hydrolase superfamily lysophospholipase